VKQPLTLTQAAELLSTTRQNVFDAIRRGRLKATKLGFVILIAALIKMRIVSSPTMIKPASLECRNSLTGRLA